MGAMGSMYAKVLSQAGWKKCVHCALSVGTLADSCIESTSVIRYQNTRRLRPDFMVRAPLSRLIQPSMTGMALDVPGVFVFPDGHGVSRSSDFIIYSVEAEFIDRVVAEYGPCMSFACLCRCFVTCFL